MQCWERFQRPGEKTVDPEPLGNIAGVYEIELRNLSVSGMMRWCFDLWWVFFIVVKVCQHDIWMQRYWWYVSCHERFHFYHTSRYLKPQSNLEFHVRKTCYVHTNAGVIFTISRWFRYMILCFRNWRRSWRSFCLNINNIWNFDILGVSTLEFWDKLIHTHSIILS